MIAGNPVEVTFGAVEAIGIGAEPGKVIDVGRQGRRGAVEAHRLPVHSDVAPGVEQGDH